MSQQPTIARQPTFIYLGNCHSRRSGNPQLHTDKRPSWYLAFHVRGDKGAIGILEGVLNEDVKVNQATQAC